MPRVDIVFDEAAPLDLQGVVFPDQISEFRGALKLFAGNGGGVEAERLYDFSFRYWCFITVTLQLTSAILFSQVFDQIQQAGLVEEVVGEGDSVR